MRRWVFLIWYLMLSLLPVMAQENEDIIYIARLMAVDPEDLDDDDVERFSALLKRPVLLNISSQDELNSCGIFTRYQVASLMHYRDRSGPCLSFFELAALNGFGDDFVARIRPFVSLESLPDLAGRANHEITGRTSWRYTPEIHRYGYTLRYKLQVGEMMNLSVACNRSLDAEKMLPDAVCSSVQLRLRRIPATIVVGDFNARFGQGLALWTGSNFTSLNTPSAFMKRNFGVTPSSSFTGSNVLTGFAGTYTKGAWSYAVFTAMPGVKSVKSQPENLRFLPACNLIYGWKNGQVGMTHYLEFGGMKSELYIPTLKTSCDFAMCLKGVDYFSEIMFDWVKLKPSAIAGVVAPVGDGSNVAAMLRSLDAEYALSVSGSMKKKRLSGSASADMSLYTVPKDKTQDRSLQLKFHTQWQYLFSESWQWNVRLTERVRSWGRMFRTDLRSDFVWKSQVFTLTYRLNVLQCKDLAWLTYLEGGVKYGKLSAYLRQGFFVVDHWDDRIYAYERDVPGAYNVPALYGRGVWTSLMTSWKPSEWCRLYLRAAFTAYPFMEEKKPGKAELRFQTVFDF